MSYYQYHLFFCTNRRDDEPSCGAFGSNDARDYIKERCKALGIHGEGQVRINKAGCLGRCEHGPVIAVYPDAVWYTYVDREDLDEIVERHLQQGEIVERLKL